MDVIADRDILSINYLEATIARWGSSVFVPRGTTLLSQGHLQTEWCYILGGIVKLVRIFDDGTETIVSLQSRGFAGGVGVLFLRRPSEIEITTCTDLRVIYVRMPTLMGALENDVKFARAMHTLQSYEHKELLQHHLRRVNPNALARTSDIIKELSRYNWPAGARQGGLLRREIAQLIGVTPEHLSRLLRRLKAEHREVVNGTAPVPALRVSRYRSPSYPVSPVSES